MIRASVGDSRAERCTPLPTYPWAWPWPRPWRLTDSAVLGICDEGLRAVLKDVA